MVLQKHNACCGGWCCQSLGEWYFLAGACTNTCWPFNSILLSLFLYFRYVFSILKDFAVLQQDEEYTSLDATTAGEQFRCHAAGAQLANLRVFLENGRRAVLSVLSEAAQFNLLSPSHFLFWPQFLFTFVIFRRKEARKWLQEKRKGR